MKPPTPKRLAALRRDLLSWFRRTARQLPWRETRDPYAIWISEIMLQQTRVETVIDYYRRFLRRFPDVGTLARARQSSVLKAWEGLGYYSRARHLHAAARRIVSEHEGQLPRTAEELRRLPGIGPYSAGAIASIAFDLDEPVLDGNVTRVLCRLFAINADITRTETRNRLWQLARELIPKGRAGTFNQAMMELGAMICLPRSPDCENCPVARHCLARAEGEPQRLPFKRRSGKVPHYDIVAAVIRRRDGKILIDRRPSEGLLGGLWEFPGGKVEPGESHVRALRRELREELGIGTEIGRPLITVRHAYSHFRITLHVYRARIRGGRPRPIHCEAIRWVRPADLHRYAFPKANHAILERLKNSGNPD